MEKKRPTWLLPNLFSLDAPIVAVAWAWMFSQTWRVVWYDRTIFWLLGAAVWMIYILDRLLDNFVSKGARQKVSFRHYFHQKNSVWFRALTLILLGFSLALAIQLPRGLWAHAIPVVLLVIVYFFMTIFVDQEYPFSLFKNAVAGITFSYGVALGIYFFKPTSGFGSLFYSVEMWSFALLCMANITAIDLWEASRAANEKELKNELETTLTILLFFISATALFFAVLGDTYAKPFYYAILVASGLLQIINKVRSRFSLDALRALADLALIAPLPIFWLMYQG